MKGIFGFIKPIANFPKKNMFILYCMALGFIGILECSMSYYFPIELKRTFGSNLSVGLIIGLANIAALVCDFVIPEIFKKKSWKFLFVAGVFLQIGYPGFTQLNLFFNLPFFLIIAALFWNIYFEFLAFSRHSFIVSNEKKDDYSKDWGIISVIGGIAAVMGPIIGSQIAADSRGNGTVILIVLQLLAVAAVILLIIIAPKPIPTEKLQHHRHIKWSILKEFKLWELFGQKIFPIILLGSMLTIISSAVSTVGGIMGEKIFGTQGLDWLLLFFFNAPIIFVSLLLSRMQVHIHKKRLSQISMILSGIALFLLPFIKDIDIAVIICFFFASIFISISWIFNEAVYSDLSKRSGENKLYVTSMERINESLGYMLGPIIIGFLADKFNYFYAFGLIGFVSIIVATFLIITTPRKILMPHQ